MMTIYQVTEKDTGRGSNRVRFYWYATEEEALAHKYNKEIFAGLTSVPKTLGTKTPTCEITPHEVLVSKRGIAEEMNWVIGLTQFNVMSN
jgi:hypothetical protein